MLSELGDASTAESSDFADPMRRRAAILAGTFVDVLTWATVIGCGVTMLLQLSGGALGRWLLVAQSLTPWVMPWVLVAGVVAACRRRRGLAAGAGMIAATYAVLIAPLVFPDRLAEATAGGERLRVVHANLLFSNPSIDAAIDVLLDADADVIALSELTPEFAAAIQDSAIGDTYRFHLVAPDDPPGGLGIWSRRPLLAGEPVEGSRFTVATGVRLGGRTLDLLVTHPLPPLFDGDRWRDEMDAIDDRVRTDLADTALVGDLNVSYFHPVFRGWLDDTGLRDVHRAHGHGFSMSWPTDEIGPPFVRIDHALVGDALTATDIGDLDIPGSDHRGFVVTLAWAAAP